MKERGARAGAGVRWGFTQKKALWFFFFILTPQRGGGGRGLSLSPPEFLFDIDRGGRGLFFFFF